ncbi:MAG: hypothetical protein M3502_03295 [Actinomycetota bacterium]|nr:hypothetical protein [Actinomycetota bacterium]
MGSLARALTPPSCHRPQASSSGRPPPACLDRHGRRHARQPRRVARGRSELRLLGFLGLLGIGPDRHRRRVARQPRDRGWEPVRRHAPAWQHRPRRGRRAARARHGGRRHLRPLDRPVGPRLPGQRGPRGRRHRRPPDPGCPVRLRRRDWSRRRQRWTGPGHRACGRERPHSRRQPDAVRRAHGRRDRARRERARRASRREGRGPAGERGRRRSRGHRVPRS